MNDAEEGFETDSIRKTMVITNIVATFDESLVMQSRMFILMTPFTNQVERRHKQIEVKALKKSNENRSHTILASM